MNSIRQSPHRNPAGQNGAALFVSLIMLTVMTLLVVAGTRMSNLELIMGKNTQNNTVALARAEDSVVTGELFIEANAVGDPSALFTRKQNDGLYLDDELILDTTDWDALVREETGEGEDYREYILEYLGPTPSPGSSLAVGAGSGSLDIRYLYRVSGRGASSKGSERVVQTIYATAP
jgi:Tfp pilus assembly protein PilX